MSTSEPVRIAMWSGPRNLSTALMRSFGNRPGCVVTDEPFYACYLRLSGATHPMRREVLASQSGDWLDVAKALAGPVPGGAHLWYQKHMTHHMLPDVGRDWMNACRNAFLIRHPARVLHSYAGKRQSVVFSDIGFAEQAELFDAAACIAGEPPPVIDADALLADPPGVLGGLCEALSIPFHDAMLSWPPGRRDSDGVWGAHWYDKVEKSTGFGSPTPMPKLGELHLQRLEERALPIYERLAAYALS
jgi:hypothetical protein